MTHRLKQVAQCSGMPRFSRRSHRTIRLARCPRRFAAQIRRWGDAVAARRRFPEVVDVQGYASVIQTHGVHRDPKGNRNLFTVEAMAPLVFTGVGFAPRRNGGTCSRSR
jgi:hypothetical protein